MLTGPAGQAAGPGLVQVATGRRAAALPPCRVFTFVRGPWGVGWQAKAHFRLGLAQFQLAERRQGSEADTQQLLTDAAASLATSDELKPNGVTKAKLAAAQKLLDEQVLAGVEPLQQ